MATPKQETRPAPVDRAWLRGEVARVLSFFASHRETHSRLWIAGPALEATWKLLQELESEDE